tara:strand:- start:118 stop:957 length:840 start_codon:yes stop_codon:yes gene_type:complete
MSTKEESVQIIGSLCVKNKLTNRQKILDYEKIAKEMPQVDIPVNHYIHGGMYGREITIPKDTILTGMIYKFDHFDIMISGDITVSTDGEEPKRLTGFNVFNGLSGKKRAGYAHEDTHWITFHPSEGVNGDEIQSDLTAESFEELESFYIDVNRIDYLNFVDSIDMTQEEITKQVENTADINSDDLDGAYVSDSQIQGKGLFSYLTFLPGETIAPARVGNTRTNAGRYCNHALFANAEIIITESGADLVALKNIEESDEITVNYRHVLNHRLLKGDLCQE